MKPNITDAERRVIDRLAVAWNEYNALQLRENEDKAEFRQCINRAAAIIAVRVARRVNPECWTPEDADVNYVVTELTEQPDPAMLRMFHGEALQEGDWAVEYSNPGHFLKVHPDAYGNSKLAKDPRYSFFRKREADEKADESPDGQEENAGAVTPGEKGKTLE